MYFLQHWLVLGRTWGLGLGANTELRDSFGNTALDYARAEDHDLASQLLQAAGRAEKARIQVDYQKQRYAQAAVISWPFPITLCIGCDTVRNH